MGYYCSQVKMTRHNPRNVPIGLEGLWSARTPSSVCFKIASKWDKNKVSQDVTSMSLVSVCGTEGPRISRSPLCLFVSLILLYETVNIL